MNGSLFSEVNGYLPVYEGTWFETDTVFGVIRDSIEE